MENVIKRMDTDQLTNVVKRDTLILKFKLMLS